MTSYSLPRDWKVSSVYRLLVVCGWTLAMGALYLAALAFTSGDPSLWGASAVAALAAVAIGITLPEPLPRDMLSGRARRVASSR